MSNIRKAVLRIEVLYDDTIGPPPSSLSLEEIAQEGITGHYSVHRSGETDMPLTDTEFLQACSAHGTDPTFFTNADDAGDVPPATPDTATHHFLVTWTIDSWASSLQAAAQEALKIQRNPASIATIFTVEQVDTKERHQIDLAPDQS